MEFYQERRYRCPMAWEIDWPSLYGRAWHRRNAFHLREHLFPAPGLDACLALYYIGEIGIHKEVGYLAVFKEAARPRLVHKSGWTLFWYNGDQSLRWDERGKLAFVGECVSEKPWWASEIRRFDDRPCVFDLPNERWCRLAPGADFHPLDRWALPWKAFRARRWIF